MAAGLGAVQPQQGLSVLAGLLGRSTSPVKAIASPIHWPALARARRQLAGFLAEHTAPALPASSGTSVSLSPAVQRLAAPGASQQALYQSVMSVVQGVMGLAVEASQPLMEVRVPYCNAYITHAHRLVGINVHVETQASRLYTHA